MYIHALGYSFYLYMIVSFSVLSDFFRNAHLTRHHQSSVLSLLVVSHTHFIDELTAIFELRSFPKEKLVMAVQEQLNVGRLKEAVICAFTFGVQRFFKTEQVRAGVLYLSRHVYETRLVLATLLLVE